jgi:hypothetical protein
LCRCLRSVVSDFRVAYQPFAPEPDAFISQQMQIASVRVVGVDDPAAQAAMFDRLKQTISKFFEFAHNQHVLSQRGHSHFRVVVGEEELRYVNDAGQPLIFVSPVEAPGEAPPVVIRLDKDITYPPLGWVTIWLNRTQFAGYNGVADVYGLQSGATTTLIGAGRQTIYFGPLPEDQSLEDVLRSQFNDQETADFVLSTSAFSAGLAEDRVQFPLEDAPQFVGMAVGYAAIAVDENGISSPSGFLEYPTPQPIYELRLGVRLQLTEGFTTIQTIDFVSAPGVPRIRITQTTTGVNIGVYSQTVGRFSPVFTSFAPIELRTFRYVYEERDSPFEELVVIIDETTNTFSATLLASVVPSEAIFQLSSAAPPAAPPFLRTTEVPTLFDHTLKVPPGNPPIAGFVERQVRFSADSSSSPETVTVQLGFVNYACLPGQDYTVDGLQIDSTTFDIGEPSFP